MISEAVRQYRQDFALCVLLRNPRALTASEVAEHIQVLAMEEGHDKALWAGCNPTATFGILRTLEMRDLVDRGAPRKAVRKGRDEPTFEPRQPRSKLAPIPAPPAPEEIVPRRGDLNAAVANPLEGDDGLSPVQMLAMLDVHARLADSVARFLRDLDEQREYARRRLQGVGLKVPAG